MSDYGYYDYYDDNDSDNSNIEEEEDIVDEDKKIFNKICFLQDLYWKYVEFSEENYLPFFKNKDSLSLFLEMFMEE